MQQTSMGADKLRLQAVVANKNTNFRKKCDCEYNPLYILLSHYPNHNFWYIWQATLTEQFSYFIIYIISYTVLYCYKLLFALLFRITVGLIIIAW